MDYIGNRMLALVEYVREHPDQTGYRIAKQFGRPGQVRGGYLILNRAEAVGLVASRPGGENARLYRAVPYGQLARDTMVKLAAAYRRGGLTPPTELQEVIYWADNGMEYSSANLRRPPSAGRMGPVATAPQPRRANAGRFGDRR